MEEKQQISYEDFSKLDIRIGKILSAEKLGNKMLKLVVDIGNEKRQVIAGIANYYKPEDVLGKRVLILVNIKPRTILNNESNGMLLVAFDKENDKLSLLSPEKDINEGAKVM